LWHACSVTTRVPCKSSLDRMPYLDPVKAKRDQSRAPRRFPTLPANQLHLGRRLLQPCGSHPWTARRLSMRRIDRQHVHLGLFQLHARSRKISRPRRWPRHQQAALRVLRRVRKLQFFCMSLTVIKPLRRTQRASRRQFSIDCGLQDTLASSSVVPTGHGYQFVFSHYVMLTAWSRFFQSAGFAIGPELPTDAVHCVTGRPETRDFDMISMASRTERSGEMVTGSDDHSALRALHTVDFFGLPLDGHAAVHETQPALPRHGNGEARLGDSIHCRGDERNIQRNFFVTRGLRIDVGRKHRGFSRQQQTSSNVRPSTIVLLPISLGRLKNGPENNAAQRRPLARRYSSKIGGQSSLKNSFYARRHLKSARLRFGNGLVPEKPGSVKIAASKRPNPRHVVSHNIGTGGMCLSVA